MEDVTIKGYWWFPDNPQDRLAGVLTYSPGKDIKLDLFGAWDDGASGEIWPRLHDEGEVHSIIHGRSSANRDITLIKCEQIQAEADLNAPFVISTLRVREALDGLLIDDFDSERFYGIEANIPALYRWCPTGLIRDYIRPKDKEWGSITLMRPSCLGQVEIEEGYTLAIEGRVNMIGENMGVSIRVNQSSNLVIESGDAHRFVDLCLELNKFEDFLSFAMLTPLCVTDITLHWLEKPDRFPYGCDSVKLYRSAIPMSRYYDFGSIVKLRPFFTFRDVKEDFASMMRKWFDPSSDYADVIDHLILLLKPEIFNKFTFLTAIQAVEGLAARIFRKEFGLKEVLEKLRDRYGHLMKDPISDDEIRGIMDSRHHYSHMLLKGKKKQVKTDIDLYLLTTKLRIMLVIGIAQHVGISDGKILEFMNNSESDIFSRGWD